MGALSESAAHASFEAGAFKEASELAAEALEAGPLAVGPRLIVDAVNVVEGGGFANADNEIGDGFSSVEEATWRLNRLVYKIVADNDGSSIDASELLKTELANSGPLAK